MAVQPKKPGAGNVLMFRRGASFEGEEELQVGLPPSAVSGSGPVAKVGVDLGGLPPVWFLVGAGWSGKTMLARWLGWRSAEEAP